MGEKIILIGLVAFSVTFGFFLFFKPLSAFEFQRKFYEKINWRVEPISVEKEIRNTKMMGVILITFAVLGLVWGMFFTP